MQYRLADSDVFTDAEYDGTDRSVRLTGLFSSTLYAIQVRATNEEGMSVWSESSEWTTSELLIVPGSGGGGTSPPPRQPPPQPPPSSPVVTIPDANLRAVIEDSLNKAPGTPITRDEMSTLTVFQAPDANISDLTGLEFATRLTNLYLQSNSISDISSLSGLTNLEWLSLGYNSISDISSLSGLTNLIGLVLESNSISDISSLSGLTNLEWLLLGNNSISNISSLVANTGLGSDDEVDVRNNPLSATSLNTHIPTLQGRGVSVRHE